MELVFLLCLGFIFGTDAIEDINSVVKRNTESLKILTKRVDRITLDFHSFESRLEIKMQTMFDEWKSAIANRQAPNMGSTLELEITKNMKTVLEETVHKQSAIVHRTLAVEKRQMRKLKSDIQSEIMNFEANTSNKLRAINESLERSIQLSENIQTETDRYKHEVKSNFVEMKSEMRDHNDTLKNIRETLTSNEIEITDMNAKIDNSISTIASRISSNTNNISSLSRQMSSSASDISRLSSQLASNTNSISSQSSRISNLYSKRSDFSAFSAELTKKLPKYPKSKTIVFDRVYSNYGYDYSSSTGIYTAPVSGYYLFFVNVECFDDKHAHVVITNGRVNIEANAKSKNGERSETGSNTGILYLTKGEQIRVDTAKLESFYDIWPWRTTFGGMLLYAD